MLVPSCVNKFVLHGWLNTEVYVTWVCPTDLIFVDETARRRKMSGAVAVRGLEAMALQSKPGQRLVQRMHHLALTFGLFGSEPLSIGG
jgi:hypothetical protein